MKHVIRIPDWVPPIANQWVGRHWAIKNKLKKQAAEFIGVYASIGNVPPATGKRSVTLIVTWAARRGRLPDADAFDKLMLDALVSCGILTDDNANGIDGRMKVVVIRGAHKDTTIELEDK